jgi:PAS domain S-box-containing protein
MTRFDLEAQFHQVIESMSDAFAAIDRDWRFTYVNERYARMSGRRREELIGQVVWELFPEAMKLRVYEAAHRSMNEGITTTVEEYYSPLDVWFESRLYPTPEGIASFITDISERKRLEQRRERYLADERRLAAIVESSEDPIIGKDLNGTVTSWNPAAERLFGYTAAEMLGRSIRTIIPPERQHEEDDVLEQIRSGHGIHQFETVRVSKDGLSIEVSLTISPIKTPEGEIIGVSTIVRDLTPLREYALDLERQVHERTADLQGANARLEAFAFSVAHDLRAPLRGMHGLALALLEDYGDRLDAVGRDYAERIVTEATSMDTLIQDLLAYGRLSDVELPLTRVDLREVLDASLHVLREEVSERAAIVDIDSRLPLVTGNRSVLVQVFTNLLSNALKFGGSRPQVRVWAEPRGRDMTHVWVEDQGIGIAREHQERIFGVFERLHGAEAYPGTGIGLAIVRKGVERLGGRVGVESEPGRGSRFWVELPAVEAA